MFSAEDQQQRRHWRARRRSSTLARGLLNLLAYASLVQRSLREHPGNTPR